MTDLSEQGAAAPSPRKKLVIRLVKALLTLLVVYFAGAQLVKSWQQVIAYKWTLNVPLLLLSVGLHLFTFALYSQVWCILMRGFGHTVPLRHGFKIAYIANLGRYIPGRIWPMFGMMYVAKQLKITEQESVASWGIATLVGLPPSFIASFLCILAYPQMMSESLRTYLGTGLYVAAAVSAAVSLMVIFLPRQTLAIGNWFLKLVKRKPVEFRLTVGLALMIYFGYLLGWITYGLAFWVFLHAIIPHPNIPLLVGIGSFILAYQIGYIAVFTPGGLGARELVMIGVLQPFLGPVAAGVAVAARIWNICGDIIASAIALKIRF